MGKTIPYHLLIHVSPALNFSQEHFQRQIRGSNLQPLFTRLQSKLSSNLSYCYFERKHLASSSVQSRNFLICHCSLLPQSVIHQKFPKTSCSFIFFICWAHSSKQNKYLYIVYTMDLFIQWNINMITCFKIQNKKNYIPTQEHKTFFFQTKYNK